MIQKCPHCKRDVVFSREICPACGLVSADEERGEATYMGDEARLGLAAAYTEEMETRLNETQRRGRLQTGLTIGLLIAPLVVLNTVGLFWLRLTFSAFLALVVVSWLGWRLWFGGRIARHLLWVSAAAAGISGLVFCGMHYQTINPVAFLTCLVFGLVYLWCAWILLCSRDLPEWLRYQRHRQREEWG